MELHLGYLLMLPLALSLHMKEPTLPVTGPRNAQERWLDVRLNHFDASNTETFPMRFYYNEAPATTNDIVIFLGGEWAISPGWATAGLPYELAADVGAAMFYTEHRYYGQTRPTNDTSSANLKYLIVDQALGDLAHFIEYVRSDAFENGRYKGGKVALFGCSYSGSMATWMKLAYPHLVTAAMSDSGPLHAQEDFPEYLEVITEAIRTQGGEQCLSSIEDAMKGLVSKLEQAAGPASVSDMFNTCAPLNAASPLDRATFFWFGITEQFAALVQYAKPGDIPKACEVLTNANVSDPVQRLANWIKSPACIEARYDKMIEDHTDLSFDAQNSVMRLWTYQTCVEYGWYQTTTSSGQPFLDVVPLEYFHQMCADFFGPDFTQARLSYGVARTNLFFSDFSLPDHVVSVQGAHDPWSPMGPKEAHARDLAPVYVVPETSHCRVTTPKGSTDDPILEATKDKVLYDMYLFLKGVPPYVSHGQTLLTPLLLMIAALAVCL